MVWYPNARQQVAGWTVIPCELVDSIIIYDELLLNDLPPLQMTSLYSYPNFSEHMKQSRENIVDAAFERFGSELISKITIPSKEDHLNPRKHHPLSWDPIDHMSKNDNQSILSFNEQNMQFQLVRKQLMHIQVYQTFLQICYVSAVEAILKIIKSPKTHNFIKSIDIVFCYEIGQVSAESLSSIDIILRRVRKNNIFLGGLFIISTIGHTQIQPIEGRPFLTSFHIIPCFRTVKLKHSVRANKDPSW